MGAVALWGAAWFISGCMASAFQVLSDCPSCRVESALLEIFDPDLSPGVAIEARCRICGFFSELGETIREGQRFASANAAKTALRQWAYEEGEGDLAVFCMGSLGGLSIEEACQRLIRREPIQTSFDVVSFLFPGMGGGGMGAVEAPDAVPEVDDVRVRQPTPSISVMPTSAESPRILARALAAVMMADGEARRAERTFIAEKLSAAGLEALSPDEERSWRPGDLGWPSAPGPILEAMARLAHADGQRDKSEWRVVREFARHWGQPLAPLERLGEQLAREIETPLQRLWRSLKGLVITTEERA